MDCCLSSKLYSNQLLKAVLVLNIRGIVLNQTKKVCHEFFKVFILYFILTIAVFPMFKLNIISTQACGRCVCGSVCNITLLYMNRLN